MSTFVGYRDGGKTNEEGLFKFLTRFFTGGNPTTTLSTSMAVVQRGAGANMSVDVSIGDVHIPAVSLAYSYWGWSDAATNVVITTANPSNPRIDAIVAYIDLSVVSSVSNNNPNALKFAAVAGTAAGSPVAPLDAAITTAMGSNPWVRLANVLVGTGVTSIVTGNVTDARTNITSKFLAGANTVPTAGLQNGSVTPDKLSASTIDAYVAASSSTTNTAYNVLADGLDTTASVTVGANGTAEVSLNGILQSNTGNSQAWMGFTVTGATTVAATDSMALMYQAYTTGAQNQQGATFKVTGLTPGVNVFHLVYRASANTATFQHRRMLVKPT